jgi:IS30 family transposase
MATKGRCRPPRLNGSNHPMAKITESDVMVIRAAHAAGFNRRFLADIFNLHRHTVSRIVSRRAWPHVA